MTPVLGMAPVGGRIGSKSGKLSLAAFVPSASAGSTGMTPLLGIALVGALIGGSSGRLFVPFGSDASILAAHAKVGSALPCTLSCVVDASFGNAGCCCCCCMGGRDGLLAAKEEEGLESARGDTGDVAVGDCGAD